MFDLSEDFADLFTKVDKRLKKGAISAILILEEQDFALAKDHAEALAGLSYMASLAVSMMVPNVAAIFQAIFALGVKAGREKAEERMRLDVWEDAVEEALDDDH